MNQTNRSIYTKIIYGFAFLLSILVVVGIMLLRAESQHKFPTLPDGVFVGSINIKDKKDPFFVIADNSKKSLTFFSEKDERLPEKIILNQAFAHITVSLNGEGLKFLGGKSNDPIFEGELIRLSDGAEGSWRLKKTIALDEVKFIEPPEQSASTVKDVLELLHTESSIANNYEKISEQRKRIEDLQSKVFDGPSYKQHAKERLADTETAVEYARDRLKVKQDQSDSLQEKLKIAVKISKRGRLVSLARESLERERRWIDSVLRMGISETSSPEVEQEYQKALEIKNLQNQIRIEEDEIARLQGGEAASPKLEEGKFYENLEQ